MSDDKDSVVILESVYINHFDDRSELRLDWTNDCHFKVVLGDRSPEKVIQALESLVDEIKQTQLLVDRGVS